MRKKLLYEKFKERKGQTMIEYAIIIAAIIAAIIIVAPMIRDALTAKGEEAAGIIQDVDLREFGSSISEGDEPTGP
ncbi:MAG: hypothetical protein KAS87_04760 [Candidatus Omnitrophica bacterium]|nr:hypothetical protein [Candidatus Omnitrophota bacterium]